MTPTFRHSESSDYPGRFKPRLTYTLEGEQIDGPFGFNTDDYIVAAKWTKDPIGRDQLDILDAKVRRQGKNALGALFSVSSYTCTALDKWNEGSTFIAADVQELFPILDGRVGLDKVLRSNKRHVNNTGSCMLPRPAGRVEPPSGRAQRKAPAQGRCHKAEGVDGFHSTSAFWRCGGMVYAPARFRSASH